ncbi:hypothetical protein C8Q75DRAFT_806556 [Abortiporus biennis]|nr:hypothetical protein C8Q75DRAFT_806556 [Abortiporus biennis]
MGNYDPNFPPNLDIHPLDYNFTGQNNDSFDISAQEEAIKTYGIAGRVWEASYAMTVYLNSGIQSTSKQDQSRLEYDPPFLLDATEEEANLQVPSCPERHDHRYIIELGSGMGVVAARLAQVLTSSPNLAQTTLVVTDLPEVCPLLEKNLHDYLEPPASSLTTAYSKGSLSNNPPKVIVRPLAWGNREHAEHLHHEMVYFPELLAPLLRTLLHLTSPPFQSHNRNININTTQIIISYKIRSLAKESTFWSAFGLWFDFEPVFERERERIHPRSSRVLSISSSSSSSPSDSTPIFNTSSRNQHSGSRFKWRRLGSSLNTSINHSKKSHLNNNDGCENLKFSNGQTKGRGGEDEDEDEDDSEIYVFTARRKPESFSNTWFIPEDDEELVGGVGANGTLSKKSDETFESLLLLSLACGLGENSSSDDEV